MGSAVKRKNLLLEEQILSFKTDPTETEGKSRRVASSESKPITLILL